MPKKPGIFSKISKALDKREERQFKKAVRQNMVRTNKAQNYSLRRDADTKVGLEKFKESQKTKRHAIWAGNLANTITQGAGVTYGSLANSGKVKEAQEKASAAEAYAKGLKEAFDASQNVNGGLTHTTDGRDEDSSDDDENTFPAH